MCNVHFFKEDFKMKTEKCVGYFLIVKITWIQFSPVSQVKKKKKHIFKQVRKRTITLVQNKTSFFFIYIYIINCLESENKFMLCGMKGQF